MNNRRYFYYFVKRLFDIVLSLIGIILLIPFSLLIKIIYLLTLDFKSIFFIQERIGKNGKTFKLIKYRTMILDSDKELDKLLKNKSYKSEWDNKQKIKNDPRITNIGKKLRKHAIDEIPQVINIFLGSMSFVGPRPLVKGELEKHNGNKKYNNIKPGLTGYWIINRRKEETYKDRLDLEYYYIDNQSIKLDLICLIKTITKIL